MWKILATSERYEIPNVASRSSVGINPKQLQMSMPIEPERRQFLWYFLYLCWDRPGHQKRGSVIHVSPSFLLSVNLLINLLMGPVTPIYEGVIGGNAADRLIFKGRHVSFLNDLMTHASKASRFCFFK